MEDVGALTPRELVVEQHPKENLSSWDTLECVILNSQIRRISARSAAQFVGS